MNKTRKNKYLRKNRHSKHSKRSKHGNKKNKTRKVQRGGRQPLRSIAVDSNSNINSNNIGDTVKGTPEVVDTNNPSSKDPVLEAARIQQDALKKSENEQKPPSPMWGVVPQSWAAAVAGFAAGIGAESRDALSKAEASVAHQDIIGTIIENSKKNIDEVDDTSIRYRKKLHDLNQEKVTPENIAKEEIITNALSRVTQFIDTQENNLPKLNMADKTGNLALLETPMGMGMGMGPGMGPGMMDSHGSVHKKSPPPPKGGPAASPAAPAAASAATSAAEKAQPSLTDKIKNKLKNAAAATKKIFRKKSPQEVEAAAQAKAKREAEAQAHRAEQIKKEEAVGLTRGKGIVGRTSDSVKNTVMSLKKTLTTNPFNKTQKKTDPENTSESEPLLGDSSRSNDSATQKKSWRESASARLKTAKNALISTKDALLNRITRKNRGTQNPEGSAIEMQEMKANINQPISSANSSQTPPSPAEVATPPQTATPPPPPTATPASQTMRPPLPPPRPKSGSPSLYSQLSQSSTVSNAGENDPENIMLPPRISKPSPRPFRPLPPLPQATQGGGNITRKNRQYIHEIKDNRTHLFNKEMEIINSIRNFKHGHHYGKGRNENGKNKPENIQKKFIKVIKRS